MTDPHRDPRKPGRCPSCGRSLYPAEVAASVCPSCTGSEAERLDELIAELIDALGADDDVVHKRVRDCDDDVADDGVGP